MTEREQRYRRAGDLCYQLRKACTTKEAYQHYSNLMEHYHFMANLAMNTEMQLSPVVFTPGLFYSIHV